MCKLTFSGARFRIWNSVVVGIENSPIYQSLNIISTENEQYFITKTKGAAYFLRPCMFHNSDMTKSIPFSFIEGTGCL